MIDMSKEKLDRPPEESGKCYPMTYGDNPVKDAVSALEALRRTSASISVGVLVKHCHLESGYIYAPYMPLFVTPPIVWPDFDWGRGFVRKWSWLTGLKLRPFSQRAEDRRWRLVKKHLSSYGRYARKMINSNFYTKGTVSGDGRHAD